MWGATFPPNGARCSFQSRWPCHQRSRRQRRKESHRSQPRDSRTVEKPDEIAPAIRRAEKEMRSGRPALLEMITVPMPKYGGYGRRGLGYGG